MSTESCGTVISAAKDPGIAKLLFEVCIAALPSTRLPCQL